MTSLTQKFFKKFDRRQYYLSGCIDIIVVQQNNGSLKSTPFHVKFGKYDGQDYQVDLIVNGNLTNVKMRLGKEGAAYFEKSSISSGYQSDDTCSEKISHFDEASIFRQPINYQKPDDLFNSDKKNSNWLQKFNFWSKGSNQKKENGVKIETTNNLKEFQQEDTSSELSKIQLDKQNLEFQQQQSEKQIQTQDFEKDNVTYSDKETLSPRQSAMELSLCGQQLQQQNLTQIQRQQLFEQHKVSFTTFAKDSLKIINNKDLIFKIGDKFFSREAGLIQLLAKQIYNQEMIIDCLDQQKKQNPQQQQQWYSVYGMFRKKKESDQIEEKNNVERENNNEKTQKQHQQFKAHERIRKLSEDLVDNMSTMSIQRRRKLQRPILKPHSSILKQLGLQKGANKITYRLCIPKKNEIVEQHGTIYLYDQKTKLVISDIDGTITKSDILGQLMPKLGTDWNHDGVANFYQNIESMGYKIMYLTARAIGQADQTKEFIYNLQQQNNKLPKGPVILSPDSLFPAFKREIIDGTPELFKISALKEVRNLFIGENPFYCGFGNRANDFIAYQAVNIDSSRIFIIDSESQIHKYNTDQITSYVELNKNIHLYFPPVDEEEYQSQNFWKIPIPDNIDINYS